jgi:hypothetical protein
MDARSVAAASRAAALAGACDLAGPCVARSVDQWVRRRRVAAPSASASEVCRCDDCDIEHAARSEGSVDGGSLEGVEAVGEGECVGDGVEQLGHVGAGDEQSAEDELGQHDRGHELDGLELGASERAGE